MKVWRPLGVLGGFIAEDLESEYEGLSHCGEQWLPSSWRIDRHRHTGHEVYLQLTGRSVWMVANQVVSVVGRQFLLVRGGVAHALATAPASDYRILFAGFHANRVDLKLAPRRAPFLHGTDEGGRIESALRRLADEVLHERKHRREMLRLLTASLLLETERMDDGPPKHAARPLHPAVDAACRAMSGAPGEPWPLRVLASRSGASAPHLVRLFRTSLGTTPRQYLLARRMERASGLLRSTDLPITQIALELGFHSSQHFASAFRQHFKMAPTQYRSKQVDFV